ncbi:MAG: hypothetical protein ACK574_05745 [Bacteroidota bacterium]
MLIYLTTSKNEAGWRTRRKQHLLY